MGLVNIKDSESGRTAWVNTDSKAVRRAYSDWMDGFVSSTSRLLRRYKVDSVDISTDSDYVKGLMKLFAGR